MTTTDIARRNGTPGAALALHAGQTMWDKNQHAALVAMGIPKEATSAELGVFLHQCQRTGLDPFAKQIYLIYRRAREGDRWVSKPTTQVGIDGLRVIRDRIAKREGASVEYEDTIWYDSDGGEHDVWLWDSPPAACKVAVIVNGRRFPGVVRFNAYAQRNKDGELVSQWRSQPDHMIEKCAEAFALRRAFPNDLSGVMLDDETPRDDDAPAAPQRVTAEQARQRRTVAATVVTPDASPAGAQATAAPSASPPSEGPAGEVPARASSGQRSKIRQEFTRLGYDPDSPDDAQAMLRRTAKLARLGELATLDELDQDQAALVLVYLGECGDIAQLDELLESGEAPEGSDA